VGPLIRTKPSASGNCVDSNARTPNLNGNEISVMRTVRTTSTAARRDIQGLGKQETAMPDQRNSAGDEMKASRAEGEFQRVSGIASARRDRGELSAGAYAVILDRARKSRDAANDDPGAA
jgi:hypothetical protein